jgi:hypothetical protein
MCVTPAAVFVEPEYGILFRNYIFFDLIWHSIVRGERSGIMPLGSR